MLTVVLETDGFEQLLENAAFLRRVGRQDRAIVLAVSKAKAGAERQEERLARLEAQQQVVTSDLGRERDRAVDLRDDVLAIETQLTSARDERQRSLDTLKVSSFRLQDELAGLERTQSRVQRTLTAAQSDNSDEFGTAPVGPATPAAGGWVMPVTGPLTSPFCEVRSYEACHPGIDIAAPEGTPIRVASSGRVVLIQSTEASGGYGNFTCVQHDASTSSCYAHQSSFATSSGASVSTGQVIGYVGSTGNSTGPHLHFEVRVDGGVVDPFNYI